MPCVIQVRSKNASPPPSAAMSSSSCSTWSLSVIDSAFGCSAQASLTVFMTHGPPIQGRRGVAGDRAAAGTRLVERTRQAAAGATGARHDDLRAPA